MENPESKEKLRIFLYSMNANKNMRKTLSLYETKTLESKSCSSPPFLWLKYPFPSSSRSGGQKRSVPFHRSWNSAQIPRKVHVGTSTSKCGTGTKRLLVIFCFGVLVPVCLVPVPIGYCMWVPVPLYVVPVPLSLQMLPLTVTLLRTS